jgi:hypothetical protein
MPVATLGFGVHCARHEQRRDQADGKPDMRRGKVRRHQPSAEHAEHHARQHDLDVPGAPFAPIDPERQEILGDGGGQDDGCGLQWRHEQRHQRQRHHAQAEEAALGHAKQAHADDGHRHEGGICQKIQGNPARMRDRSSRI